MSLTKLRLCFAVLSLLFLVACQFGTEPVIDIRPNDPLPKASSLDPEEGMSVPALQEVVVLYDDQLQSSFVSAGELRTQAYNEVDGARVNAQIIANLVGGTKGFRGSIRPVSEYQAGDAFRTARMFYLGSTYGHPIPESLIDDMLAGANITWLGYNIWQADNRDLKDKLGLEYLGIEGAYSQEAAAQSFYLIDYNNYTFNKEIQSMDTVLVKAKQDSDVKAWARKPSGQKTPYAFNHNNFWYLADVPTAWVHERDRYLVFADLIPKMLGVELSCEPRAIIRIEDVKPSDAAEDLNRIFAVFEELGIAFGIATVPIWRDEANDKTVTWQDNREALESILEAQAKQAEVFQHGYSHTYDGMMNPTGLSGADWEFWDINTNKAIPGFTAEEAVERVSKGKAILDDIGLNPIGWVTPHYAADPSFYPAFKDIYWRHFERRFVGSGDIVLGQLYPYPARDNNKRTLILPENALFISATNTLDNILETARANKALSCPWLGMFVHPYLMNPEFIAAGGEGAMTAESFKAFITDLQAMGYSFQKLSEVDVNDTNDNTSLVPEKIGFSSALVSKSTGLCMDTWSNPAFLWDCQGWTNQTYTFVPSALEEQFVIKNLYSGDCLRSAADRSAEAVIITDACNDELGQVFELKAVNDAYQIKAYPSGLCIAEANAETLELALCDASEQQLWELPARY